MYLALFSVGFGSTLTFLQAAALFRILNLDDYVAYRAVLNTMNVAAPFLCLGFDNAAPVLRRMNPGFPFFWNLLAAHLALFVLLTITSVLLPASSRLLPLSMGLAASTSVAAGLIVANHHRTEGAMNKYFVSVNIVDRAVRTVIIVALAFVVHDVLWWSVMMSTLCVVYVGFVSRRTGVPVQLDRSIFWRHVRTSFPYIFSALGIVFMTRMPFYAAYTSEGPLLTAKIDIWLLICLFLLIPALNKSKIEEAVSTGLLPPFMAAMKKSWPALQRQELLVVCGIAATATGAVLTGHAARADLLLIVLPLVLGMQLIASQPNYVQALCFTGLYTAGVRVSVLLAVLAMLTYVPRVVLPALPIPFLFVLSAGVYCAVGCWVARQLKVPLADFWRWRGLLALGACGAAALTAAYAALGVWA